MALIGLRNIGHIIHAQVNVLCDKCKNVQDSKKRESMLNACHYLFISRSWSSATWTTLIRFQSGMMEIFLNGLNTDINILTLQLLCM